MFFLASLAYFFLVYQQAPSALLSAPSLKGYLVFIALWIALRLFLWFFVLVFTRGLRTGIVAYLLRLIPRTLLALGCIYAALYSWRFFS